MTDLDNYIPLSTFNYTYLEIVDNIGRIEYYDGIYDAEPVVRFTYSNN